MSDYDPENDPPQIGEAYGKAVIILRPNSRYPFSFGLSKAQMVLEDKNLDAIRKFVDSKGKSID